MAAGAATPDDVAALRAQVEAVAASADVHTFTDEATAFLHCLVQACGNRTLGFLSALLHQLVQVEARALSGTYAPDHGTQLDAEFKAWCLDQYRQLIDLIEAGDADAARELWSQHLERMPPAIDSGSALTVYEGPRPRRR
ncbi:MAG: FCD domain-containing protein [Actinomycetota bacterium]|nr:FCD domain-containing protein [Actinomycetota bacterium]